MAGLCEGRVAVVTGAGRGIGRAHALELARQGARVVVNDLGAEVDGSGSSDSPAGEVVEEIRAAGGEAVANGDDISDPAGAQHLIDETVRSFGGIDVLVNNAGILRDRMMVNLADEEWDAVIQVHLRGTFLPSRAAATWWRQQAKAGDLPEARIINTTSASGLFGNVGQSNYGAAKAGIASLTIIAAQELARYGVTVNAIAPGARTRMTTSLGYGDGVADSEFDWSAPENISPIVAWLASTESHPVTGRVFESLGGRLCLVEGWRRGPAIDEGRRWEADELGAVVADLLDRGAEPEGMFPRG